jgi:hypothetical protein
MHELLSQSERAVLERILAGIPQLRAQLDHTRVLKPWHEGSASFDVEVTGGPRADVADGVLPVDAQVHVDGEFVGEILLWIEAGRLAAVEYAWVRLGDRRGPCHPATRGTGDGAAVLTGEIGPALARCRE